MAQNYDQSNNQNVKLYLLKVYLTVIRKIYKQTKNLQKAYTKRG